MTSPINAPYWTLPGPTGLGFPVVGGAGGSVVLDFH